MYINFALMKNRVSCLISKSLCESREIFHFSFLGLIDSTDSRAVLDKWKDLLDQEIPDFIPDRSG